MQMGSRCIGHDALIELGGLCILALLPLMRIVTLPTHDIIGNAVRRLSSIWSELVAEAVGRVLLIARVVSIAAQLTVKVEAAVVACHERAVDGNLVKVHSDTMVLGVPIEEHAELEQRIGRVFDTRDHTTGTESGLFDVTVIILWVFVED